MRLEARRLMNNIIRDVNKRSNEEEFTNVTEGLEDVGGVDAEMVSSSFSLPSKLRQTSYFQKTLSKPNAERNHLIQRVKENLNDVIAKKSNKVKKCNLSFYERKGLEWLSKKVMNEEIYVFC